MKKTLLSLTLCIALAFGIITPISANAATIQDKTSISSSQAQAAIMGKEVIFSASFGSIPSSDDGQLYVFELKTYEYSIPDGAMPITSVAASSTVGVSFPLNYTGGYGRLYNKFVFAAKRGTDWAMVCNPQYITNPEAVATKNTVRQARPQKLLQQDNVANISLNGISDGMPVGTQHIVFTNTDSTVVTADPHQTDDAHPVKNNPVVAYMLNADDDAGIIGLINDMNEYSAGFSHAQDFVIGNEVNERCWNYMAWVDWDTYVRKYAQAFRVCYTALKANNPAASVYISLDQVWNKNVSNTEYLDGDEFLAKFNRMINENGNIDWNMSIHPYPNPLYYPKFWDLSGVRNGATFKAQVDKNQVITFQNLSVLTDVLQKPEYLNRYGQVRDVIIGEIGMGTNAGNDAQAAGLAAAWAAFERNPYVTQFMYLEVDVNGFFPTMTSYTKELWDALGTEREAEYMSWAMNIIGISDWSQVLR